jgi:hypothetical protein
MKLLAQKKVEQRKNNVSNEKQDEEEKYFLIMIFESFCFTFQHKMPRKRNVMSSKDDINSLQLY